MTQEILYTPWRLKYILSKEGKEDGCIFCAVFDHNASSDVENLVLFRGPNTFAMMNIYPYNVGHIMVLPIQHVSNLTQLSQQVQLEIMRLTTYFIELLTSVLRPDGFNIGTNIGKAAGAGIDSHLHTHIVPRWSGDSNFMPVVGQTRILPEELGDTYQKISAALKERPPEL